MVVDGERATDPASGSSSPASTRSSVDFPIPFGPTTPEPRARVHGDRHAAQHHLRPVVALHVLRHQHGGRRYRGGAGTTTGSGGSSLVARRTGSHARTHGRHHRRHR